MKQYFPADPTTLSEAQCDAINARDLTDGGTSNWVPKVRHPATGAAAYELGDAAQAQMSNICTPQEAATIEANWQTEDQMFAAGWCPLDGHGVRTFNYANL